MTLIGRLIEYVDNNPFADNEEIASAINTDVKTVKVYLKRLTNRETVKITEEDGQRVIKVLELPEMKPVEFKRGVYEMMANKYLEDFKRADQFQDRIEIGKMIIRILEKM